MPRGVYERTAEARANISASLMGNSRRRGTSTSAEGRANIGASKRGTKHSAETKAKIAAGNRGKTKPCSPEHRRALSVAKLANNPNPNYAVAHARHLRHWTKTGICAICDQEAQTHWAWIHQATDPGGYSDDREDYVEMCSLCHARYDQH